MTYSEALALSSIIVLTVAMLCMLRVDNRRKARAEAEYQAMQDRHIGNAIAAMHLSYNAAPERAASGNPETRAQDIRNARARYLLAQHRRDGLPY